MSVENESEGSDKEKKSGINLGGLAENMISKYKKISDKTNELK